jgi:phosphate transport system permease protein
MARPWERLFVAAARLCAWCVVVTPFAVVAVLIGVAVAGQQRPDIVFFLGNLVVQLFATLFVAGVGTGLGASIGIGSALLTRELMAPSAARPFTAAFDFLCACPAVVLGWFGALLVLPALAHQGSAAVFLGAAIVVTMAVMPRAYLLARRVLAAVPPELRAAASAAGAATSRVAAHVVLPSVRRPIAGVYADAFARAVGEAVAVTVVFLAAVRAGYPVSLFTVPSAIMARASTAQILDAGIAQSALVILALAAVAKTMAARRIGQVQWV